MISTINIIGIIFMSVGLLYCFWSIRNILKGMFLMLFTPTNQWQKDRLNSCNRCAPKTDLCPLCGCFKVPKTKVKSEKCPLGRWGDGGVILLSQSMSGTE